MPHAEIAGAGFAGLTAALALKAQGWSVRVHERAQSLRSEGYGIAVHDNGLFVLRSLGVAEEVMATGMRVGRLVSRDATGRTVAEIPVNQTTYRISRHRTVEILGEALRASGGVIETGSAADGALPEGVLLMRDGRRLEADLVVAADGIGSKVRDSTGVAARTRLLKDGAMRLVIPRTAEEKASEGNEQVAAVENWSGSRRIITNPCSPDEVYVAMTCLACDDEGRARPLDTPSWQSHFPHLSPLLDRIAQQADWNEVFWQRFSVLRLPRWSVGRVVFLGDAAHAMPPNLGQGAGCAMMNAFSLASWIGNTPDIEGDLVAWEAAERPITEHTQRWSAVYGSAAHWPPPVRSAFFGALGRVPWFRQQYNRTARYTPNLRPSPSPFTR
jgi:2-polyprenyl-6-methoxyphenol hydroxylase-like FAD-dependent oxidoreductase